MYDLKGSSDGNANKAYASDAPDIRREKVG